LLILIVRFATLPAFLAAQGNNPGGLWYDYERRGLAYRIATAIDGVTFVV
jgi:hypothetical protein